MKEFASKEQLIAARNLRTWFELKRFGFFHLGFVRAVDGVDFSINRGEAVAFVGESGCGKSSLARTLLGIHRPTSGQVYFEGAEVDYSDPGCRRNFCLRAGFVQQDPYGALPPFMDVNRILSEPLAVNGIKSRGERALRIRSVLDEVGLAPAEDFLAKFPHMLSGGQQQRLVIARSLILRPVMIIADEPVSMIDASVRAEILNLLGEIRRIHNLAILFITHDVTSIRHFAAKIFVMYAGKIVERAPAELFLGNPLHPYSRALLSAIPDADSDNARRLKKIPGGEPPSLLNPPAGCRFHPRCSRVIPGLCDRNEPPGVVLPGGRFCACWLMADSL